MHSKKNYEQHNADLDDDDRGVEVGALFNPDYQDGSDNQSDQKCRKIKSDFHPKQGGRGHQIVGTLEQLRWLRGNNVADSRQKRLAAHHQGRIRNVCHLTGDNVFCGYQSRPMIVSQPQRHLQMKNLQKLYEMIRPAG